MSGIYSKRERTVLLVDDDPSVLNAMAVMLRRLGCRVVATASTDTALAVSDMRNIDVIVCDVIMPVHTGPTLIEHLRANGIVAPVIFVTGDPSIEHLDQALRISKASLLAKPFTLAELQRALAAAVSAA